jgi:hypothetical protein
MEQGLSDKFNPFGSGYDTKTAIELDRLAPLTSKRPTKLQYGSDGNPVYYVGNSDGTDSFKAWSWDGPEHGYRKHGSSIDPRTGQVLKGTNHQTFDKFAAEEARRGNLITLGDNGKLYVDNTYNGGKPKAKEIEGLADYLNLIDLDEDK